MDFKLLTFWILIASPLSNALFFGLFNPKKAEKPETIIHEPTEIKGNTAKIAYENYLRFLASTYSAYPKVQYIPIYYDALAYSYPSESTYKAQTQQQSTYFREPIRVIPTLHNEVTNKSEKFEYEIHESPVAADLYDLPVSVISQDFLTGGFATTKIPKNTGRFGRRLNYANRNSDGNELSKQAHLLHSVISQVGDIDKKASK